MVPLQTLGTLPQRLVPQNDPGMGIKLATRDPDTQLELGPANTSSGQQTLKGQGADQAAGSEQTVGGGPRNGLGPAGSRLQIGLGWWYLADRFEEGTTRGSPYRNLGGQQMDLGYQEVAPDCGARR